MASTGGQVVKYVVTTKAGAEYFGDGIEGTIAWDYELGSRGWVPTDDLTNDETGAMVTFTQGDASLIVTAAIDVGVTTVQLLQT